MNHSPKLLKASLQNAWLQSEMPMTGWVVSQNFGLKNRMTEKIIMLMYSLNIWHKVRMRRIFKEKYFPGIKLNNLKIQSRKE